MCVKYNISTFHIIFLFLVFKYRKIDDYIEDFILVY